MEVPLDSLIQWIPTPLLALGFWALMKKAFNDHEKRFDALLTRFEQAMKKQDEHNLSLALLQQLQTAQGAEMLRLRDKQHDLTNHFMEFQSQVLTRILDEGSGPQRLPHSPR